jgi:hypothetical protein
VDLLLLDVEPMLCALTKIANARQDTNWIPLMFVFLLPTLLVDLLPMDALLMLTAKPQTLLVIFVFATLDTLPVPLKENWCALLLPLPLAQRLALNLLSALLALTLMSASARLDSLEHLIPWEY